MINPPTGVTQPAFNGLQIRISAHSVQRYQERVDPAAPATAAAGAIRQMLCSGAVRSHPRAWTTCRVEEGMRFVYSAARADVCLVLRGSTVVTVLTAELCAQSLDRGSCFRPPMTVRGWEQRMEEEADIYEPLPDDLAWVA